jgi:hypothetical protein
VRVGIADRLAISNTVSAIFIFREITKKMLIENQIGKTNLFREENTISKLSKNKNLFGSILEYKRQINKEKKIKLSASDVFEKAHLVRVVEASGLKAKIRENQTGATLIEK